MRNITVNLTVKVQRINSTQFLTVKIQNHIRNNLLIIEFLFKIT